MNQDHEQTTAISKFAERHGIIPLKSRNKNKVIVGVGMANVFEIENKS